MTQTNEEVQARALAYAKSHRTRIARERTDVDKFPSEEQPVSVFMAGSPGAGKTEASMELLSEFDSILRIDPDDLRVEFPAYGGGYFKGLWHCWLSAFMTALWPKVKVFYLTELCLITQWPRKT